MHHAFLHISLPSLHDYDVKTLNLTFCGGRERKTTTLYFVSYTSMQSFRIQLHKKLQHLTNWLRWNKRDKDWGSACSLFKIRFRCRRRRRCLSSPFCFPDYRDNRALADDIGGFFRRKINNIRNEIRIVRAAMKEEDKVEDDSVVMENARYLIRFTSMWWSSSFKHYYNLPTARYSTGTALLKVHNDILLSMDKQRVTLLVLLDLSASSGTVNHQVLLKRLESCFGISGTELHWFKSYLDGRSQRICVRGCCSKKSGLPHGVPQGSCLVTLLFTIYATELFEIVKAHLPDVHACAVDSQLYLSFNPGSEDNQTEAVDAVQECI